MRQDGRIVSVNAALAAQIGMPQDACVDHNLLNFVAAADRGQMQDYLQATASQPCPLRFQAAVLDNDNAGMRLVDWTADLRGEAGDIILYGRDITGATLYKNALQQLIAVGNDASLTLEQRIPRILRIAHRFFGMRFGVVNRIAGNRVEVTHLADASGELAEGMHFERGDTYCAVVLDRDDVVAVPDVAQTPLAGLPCYRRIALGSLLATPIYVNGQKYGALLFGDDKPRDGNFSADQINLLSLAGQWLSYELAASERRGELESGEQRYRNLYRRTPVMMHSVDWSGRLVEVSDTWLASLGYHRKEVIGRQMMEFMTEESALKAAAERMTIGSAVDRIKEPYVFRRKDGSTLDVEMSSIGEWDGLATGMLRDPGLAAGLCEAGQAVSGIAPEVSLCVLVDVTERNRAQRSSAEANASLTRANEDLKRFNLIASHDLQEPLRKIRTFGSMLEKESVTGLSEDAAYALRAMIASSRRLSELVGDLLAYTRQSDEGFEIEQVALGAIIGQVAANVALEANADAQAFHIGDLPCVHGGRTPLERLFTNLLSNAVKYADAARPLSVQVFCEPGAAGRSSDIIVRDNGIGIPPEHAERVFEPFQRLCTRKQIPGSGIGLAICRIVAARHGWKLTASPAPVHGTDFRLSVPEHDIVSRLRQQVRNSAA